MATCEPYSPLEQPLAGVTVPGDYSCSAMLLLDQKEGQADFETFVFSDADDSAIEVNQDQMR